MFVLAHSPPPRLRLILGIAVKYPFRSYHPTVSKRSETGAVSPALPLIPDHSLLVLPRMSKNTAQPRPHSTTTQASAAFATKGAGQHLTLPASPGKSV